MTDGFLPEFKIMPAKGGGYLAMYRLFEGKPFVIIPGGSWESATKALKAGKEYVRAKLNPPIRAEKAEADTLGRAQWHEQRAARQAEQQEQALGGVIVKGRTVVVERRARG
jgi:hypothetical protein